MACSNLLKSPPFIIKVVELLICIALAALTANDRVAEGSDRLVRYAVVNATIASFMLLGVLNIMGYVLGCPIHTKLVVIASAAAVILYLATGLIILETYNQYIFPSRHSNVFIAVILCFISSAAYIVDAILSWKCS
ncbi:uncharacterized protein LOC126284835 [Schistocerca gregaria]|uniref:uncharacterized protein LOC126284835 n=1 Tax=Schistocerca gregaria TaxID=7010 RepID=UPI00211F3645|nr:uncharacterized protein LOC126284835 [Schistocerca gregaria]